MLEEYLKNYYISKGLSRDDLNHLSPEEDGSFTLSFNDKFLCSVEESVSEHTQFIFYISPDNEERKNIDPVERFSLYSNRLKHTPFSGRAKLFIENSENNIGFVFSLDTDNLEQSLFNHLVDLLASSVTYVAGDSSIDLTAECYLEKKSEQSLFNNLLDEIGTSFDELKSNYFRFDVSDDFGAVLDYSKNAQTVKIINSIEFNNSGRIVDILANNNLLPSNFSFNYSLGYLYLEQYLQIENTDKKRFLYSLGLQEKMLVRIKDSLDKKIKSNSLNNQSNYLNNMILG